MSKIAMGQVYKLKPVIFNFIIWQKHKNPDLSCRKLAQIASKRFKIPISKSSVNSILKGESLSSPVGRRTSERFMLQGEVEYGGFLILQGIDEYFAISEIVVKTIISRLPAFPRELFTDTLNVVRALTIFKSISDLNIEASRCYDYELIWSIVGRRPTRSVYESIIEAINSSQLTVEELVTDIMTQLVPVSGFRFQLIDRTSFFIDSQLQSLWNTPVKRRLSLVTSYKSVSYIDSLLNGDKVLSVFNIQGANLNSQEVLDFIAAFSCQNISKRIRQVELLDLNGSVIEIREVNDAKQRFFMLGFWPWQFEGLPGLERIPSEKMVSGKEFGLEYFYQLEEVNITQLTISQEVKCRAVLLRKAPTGAVKMGILTNLPREIIHNYLNLNNLYHWVSPEDRYKKFMKWAKEAVLEPPKILPSSFDFSKVANSENKLDNIFSILSQIIFYQLQNNLLPEEYSGWSQPKIKDIFLRQRAIIKRGKRICLYKLLVDSKLHSQASYNHLCGMLNEAIAMSRGPNFSWFLAGNI